MSGDQSEFLFVEGNLEAAPWAAIIVDRDHAATLEASGKIEWTGDFYRLADHPMPEQALNWLAAISAKLEGLKLDPHDYRVLGHLIWRAGKKGACWPSYDTIAKATGISRRRVAQAINTLVGRGVIQIAAQGRANRYLIRGDLSADPMPVRPASPTGPAQGELFETPAPPRGNAKFALHLPATLSRDVDVMLALGRFERHRGEMKRKLTPTAIRLLCRKIADWTAAEIVEACERAIESGWQSLYKPRNFAKGKNIESEPAKGNFDDWKS